MVTDIPLVNRSAGCLEARRVRRNADTGGYIEYNVSRNYGTIFVVCALIFYRITALLLPCVPFNYSRIIYY